MNTNIITAFLIGCLIGAYGTSLIPRDEPYIGTKKVHVHSDLLIVINGEALDLTGDKYQSTATSSAHSDIHLHDNDDDVLHRHAEGITLAMFLESIGFILTEDCITTDAGASHCTNDSNTLSLYVNEELHPSPLTYISAEEDRILLIYGENSPEAFFPLITDRACIFSHTCPERGTPPPESCGLTCEL
jgi:hypothetical protein